MAYGGAIWCAGLLCFCFGGHSVTPIHACLYYSPFLISGKFPFPRLLHLHSHTQTLNSSSSSSSSSSATMSFVMRFSMGTESDVFRDAMSIRETVFVHEQGVPGNLERDGRDGEALHVVAYTQVVEGDGQETRARLVAAGGARARLVTHCGFRAYPTPVVKVERVCVLRHYRGKQCGEALMRFIEKTAKEVFSQAPLMLHAMLHAKGFYTRLGYTETSEVFTEADRPHIIMSKL